MTETIVFSVICSTMVSLILWNLWGLHKLEREWRKIFAKNENDNNNKEND